MSTDIKIKSKVWYLQVSSIPSYDHIGDCLFFEGKKTDSTGNPIEDPSSYPFIVPHKLMKDIIENDWLKIIDFYVDLDNINPSLTDVVSGSDQKYQVGLKIDKYDSSKNMWCFLYEKIYNIKKIQ